MKIDNYGDYNLDDEMDEQREQEFLGNAEPSDDEDTEFEALDELSVEASDASVASKPLTEENINDDLSKKCEADRTVYTFQKGDATYRGYVLAKFDKTSYLFSVEDIDASRGRRTRKFNIADIEQQ